mmetsp:Transcript_50974/g.102236  ORF Transcript_50974/g.102236 Transcript_50974/m.102236 type:complete len:148 (-) Transcript_50974:110-553(-)
MPKSWSSSLMSPSKSQSGQVNKVFPRRKAGQDARKQSKPVVLTESVLRSLFNLPLQEACNKLGICATALKKTCRKLGIKKWPYRNSRATPSPPNIDILPGTRDVVLFQETAEWFRATVEAKPDDQAASEASSDSEGSSDISVARLLN